MLQNRLLAGAIVLLTLLTACNSKKGESNIPNTTNETTADTIAAEQVADSTIYHAKKRHNNAKIHFNNST